MSTHKSHKVVITIIAVSDDESEAKAFGYAMVKGARGLANDVHMLGAARAEIVPTDNPTGEIRAFRDENERIEARAGVRGKTLAELDRAMADIETEVGAMGINTGRGAGGGLN